MTVGEMTREEVFFWTEFGKRQLIGVSTLPPEDCDCRHCTNPPDHCECWNCTVGAKRRRNKK